MTLLTMLAQPDLAPLLVSMGAGATVVLAVAAVASLRSPLRARAAGRLEALSGRGRMYQAPVSALRNRKISNIPFVDALIRGRRWTESTRELLDRADVPLLVGEYAALRVIALLVATVVAVLAAQRSEAGSVGGVALVAGSVAVAWFAPPLLLRRRLARRAAQIETQLVELCDVMASMMQSGYGYVQALSATAAEVGPPLSTELQRLLDTVRLGGDVDEALDDLNRRLGSRDFDIIATAISIQRRSGGNLGEILSGVAETIRQRQSFVREVRAITSKERFTALVVAGFPLALIALLMWMAPEPYLRLVTDVPGRLMLAAAIGLDAVGFFIIRKLSSVEV